MTTEKGPSSSSVTLRGPQRCRSLYPRSQRVLYRCVMDASHGAEHHDGNGNEWTDAMALWLAAPEFANTTADCGCKHMVMVQPCRTHDTEDEW